MENPRHFMNFTIELPWKKGGSSCYPFEDVPSVKQQKHIDGVAWKLKGESPNIWEFIIILFKKKTKLEGILVVWTHPFPAHTVGIMLQSQVWRSFTNQTISNNIRAPTREYANKVVSKALAKLVVIPNIHLSLLVIAISWKCLYTNIRIQWDQFDIFHQKLNMSMGSFFREMEVSNPWGYPISSAILIGIFHYPLVI